MRLALAVVLIAFAAARPARADVVTLANGSKMSGVVLSQKDGLLELQVDEEGFVQLDTATVASVEKQSAEKNDALKRTWRARDERAAAAEEKDRAFAQAQREKGLVFYEGEWMKPAEAEVRLAAKRLDADTHEQGGKIYMAHEGAQAAGPSLQTTVAPTYGYYLLGQQRRRARKTKGRVFVFKGGHAVQKRGRVVDLSGN